MKEPSSRKKQLKDGDIKLKDNQWSLFLTQKIWNEIGNAKKKNSTNIWSVDNESKTYKEWKDLKKYKIYLKLNKKQYKKCTKSFESKKL